MMLRRLVLMLSALLCTASWMLPSESMAAMNRPRGFKTICRSPETCRVDGPIDVAFGASGKFVFKTLNGTFTCTVDTFGSDPIPSKSAKECSIPKDARPAMVDPRPAPASAPPPAPAPTQGSVGTAASAPTQPDAPMQPAAQAPQLIRLGNANRPPGFQTICRNPRSCRVAAPTRVAFGASGRFVVRILNGQFQCVAETFGADPFPAKRVKECSIPRDAGASAAALGQAPAGSVAAVPASQLAPRPAPAPQPAPAPAAAAPTPAPQPVVAPQPSLAFVSIGSLSADCLALATDPRVNWRETSLRSDQEIVQCLAATLGRAVGYGENARGGFDPNGRSRLTIITRDGARSVEQQIVDAVNGSEPNWIVFDKDDFAREFEIGLYRTQCGNPAVLSKLGATESECRDFRSFCANRSIPQDRCVDEFFNRRLNDGDIPIRNIEMGSNKTLDGRFSNGFFLFSGFAIGQEPSGASDNVILTHLDFRGAGKVEDHELDPDMIRSTAGSSNIWIHKNSFDLTGDSAFDVKRGARNITISFNRVVDVERASLHGSNDSREVNANITTTIHNNAFVTRDARFFDFGNTGRRVPLIRRGTSHLFNNFFMNYRKNILSVRVGASVLFEDNAFLVNQDFMEKSSVDASLAELSGQLITDIDRGNFASSGVSVAFATRDCVIDTRARVAFAPASGRVRNLLADYSARSQSIISAQRLRDGQSLVDYTNATAGKGGELPFNSPLARTNTEVLRDNRGPCQ